MHCGFYVGLSLIRTMEIKKLSLNELNRPNVEEFSRQPKGNFLIVADNVRSGQNVGSLFRTADAFAAEQVCIVGLTPLPPNKEILKSALGATESVKWESYSSIEQLIGWLRTGGYKIIVIEQTSASVSLETFHPLADEKYAIVFGNEVDGVSAEFIQNADLCIEIPQIGTKHSLNVSVCAGIVMWHFFRKYFI